MGLRLRELPGLSFHQLVQRDAEHLRELYQSVQVRDAPVRLPLADGLPGDTQLFRQGVLGKSRLCAQPHNPLPHGQWVRLPPIFLEP